MGPSRQLCTFRVGDAWLALEVSRVQEVLRRPEMTRVPLAPRVIVGLINLRGQIVVAVDLRRCLGLGELPADQRSMSVVLRTDDGPMSVLVDEIDDVIDVPASAFQPPPATATPATRRLIEGAYPLGDRLVLCLNADQLLTLTAERTEAAAAASPMRNRPPG